MSEEKDKKPERKSDLSLYVVDRDEFCEVTETDEEETKRIGKKPREKRLSGNIYQLLLLADKITDIHSMESATLRCNVMKDLGVKCRDFYDEIARINSEKELYQMRHELLYKPAFDKIAGHAKEFYTTGRTTPFRINYGGVVKEKKAIETAARDLNERISDRLFKTMHEKFGIDADEYVKQMLGGRI